MTDAFDEWDEHDGGWSDFENLSDEEPIGVEYEGAQYRAYYQDAAREDERVFREEQEAYDEGMGSDGDFGRAYDVQMGYDGDFGQEFGEQ